MKENIIDRFLGIERFTDEGYNSSLLEPEFRSFITSKDIESKINEVITENSSSRNIDALKKKLEPEIKFITSKDIEDKSDIIEESLSKDIKKNIDVLNKMKFLYNESINGYVNIDKIDEPYNVFVISFEQHATSLLIHKFSDITYTIVYCNSGKESQRHGKVNNSTCNGIVIFNNITKETVTNVIKLLIVCVDPENRKNYKDFYFAFGLLLLRDKKQDVRNIFIKSLSEIADDTISVIPQITGDCTLKSFILPFFYVTFKENKIEGEQRSKILNDSLNVMSLLCIRNILNSDNIDSCVLKCLKENILYHELLNKKYDEKRKNIKLIEENKKLFIKKYIEYYKNAKDWDLNEPIERHNLSNIFNTNNSESIESLIHVGTTDYRSNVNEKLLKLYNRVIEFKNKIETNKNVEITEFINIMKQLLNDTIISSPNIGIRLLNTLIAKLPYIYITTNKLVYSSDEKTSKYETILKLYDVMTLYKNKLCDLHMHDVYIFSFIVIMNVIIESELVLLKNTFDKVTDGEITTTKSIKNYEDKLTGRHYYFSNRKNQIKSFSNCEKDFMDFVSNKFTIKTNVINEIKKLREKLTSIIVWCNTTYADQVTTLLYCMNIIRQIQRDDIKYVLVDKSDKIFEIGKYIIGNELTIDVKHSVTNIEEIMEDEKKKNGGNVSYLGYIFYKHREKYNSEYYMSDVYTIYRKCMDLCNYKMFDTDYLLNNSILPYKKIALCDHNDVVQVVPLLIDDFLHKFDKQIMKRDLLRADARDYRRDNSEYYLYYDDVFRNEIFKSCPVIKSSMDYTFTYNNSLALFLDYIYTNNDEILVNSNISPFTKIGNLNAIGSDIYNWQTVIDYMINNTICETLITSKDIKDKMNTLILRINNDELKCDDLTYNIIVYLLNCFIDIDSSLHKINFNTGKLFKIDDILRNEEIQFKQIELINLIRYGRDEDIKNMLNNDKNITINDLYSRNEFISAKLADCHQYNNSLLGLYENDVINISDMSETYRYNCNIFKRNDFSFINDSIIYELIDLNKDILLTSKNFDTHIINNDGNDITLITATHVFNYTLEDERIDKNFTTNDRIHVYTSSDNGYIPGYHFSSKKNEKNTVMDVIDLIVNMGGNTKIPICIKNGNIYISSPYYTKDNLRKYFNWEINKLESKSIELIGHGKSTLTYDVKLEYYENDGKYCYKISKLENGDVKLNYNFDINNGIFKFIKDLTLFVNPSNIIIWSDRINYEIVKSIDVVIDNKTITFNVNGGKIFMLDYEIVTNGQNWIFNSAIKDIPNLLLVKKKETYYILIIKIITVTNLKTKYDIKYDFSDIIDINDIKDIILNQPTYTIIEINNILSKPLIRNKEEFIYLLYTYVRFNDFDNMLEILQYANLYDFNFKKTGLVPESTIEKIADKFIFNGNNSIMHSKYRFGYTDSNEIEPIINKEDLTDIIERGIYRFVSNRFVSGGRNDIKYLLVRSSSSYGYYSTYREDEDIIINITKTIHRILSDLSEYKKCIVDESQFVTLIIELITNKTFTIPENDVKLQDCDYKINGSMDSFDTGRLYKEILLHNTIGTLLNKIPFAVRYSNHNIQFYINVEPTVDSIMGSIKKSPYTLGEYKINTLNGTYPIDNFSISDIENKIELEDILREYWFGEYSTIQQSLTDFYLFGLCNTNKFKDIRFCDVIAKHLYGMMYNSISDEERNDVSKLTDIYKMTPFEIYYQCIIGKVIRRKNYDLINEIFGDLNYVNGFDKKIGGNIENISSINEKIIKYKYNRQRKTNCSYSMLMGGGKTKMITPCLILRLIYYSLHNDDSDKIKYIFVVLPEQLLEQSFDHLRISIGSYFHVPVKKLREDRQGTYEYTKIFDEKNIGIYLMSDTSMKCGFINNDHVIHDNTNKSIYLFDEIDTILNPLTSELNYPTDNISLVEIHDYFNIMFNVLNEIYKGSRFNIEKEKLNVSNKSSNYPHFHFKTEMSLPTEFRNICIDVMKSGNISKKVTECLTNSSDENIDKLNDHETILVYVLLMFLDKVLPTVLSLVNRRDYGTYDDENIHIIVPFSHVENPIIKSQFSNPILIICLTIVEHLIYDKRKYSNKRKTNYCNIIKNLYIQNEVKCRPNTEIYKAYIELGIPIRLENISLASLGDNIYKILDNTVMIKIICLNLCKNEIKYSITQENIAGLDLVMSFNTRNRAGYTGTPCSGIFYDIDETFETEKDYSGETDLYELNNEHPKNIQKLYIHKMNKDDFINIKNTITSEEICSTDFSFKVEGSIKEYIITVIKKYNDFNTIIDVGGIFVGVSYKDLYEMKKPSYGSFKFVFWNDKHKRMCKDETGNEYELFNINENDNLIYYFDHQHTTGIDTVIPKNHKGIIFIGTDPRFRDVVQGLYRMRKIGKGQTAIFVGVNDRVKNTIDFFKYIIDNEIKFINSNKKLFLLQNLRALYKVCDKTEDKYKLYNNFNFPRKEKLVLCDDIDFNGKNKQDFINLVKSKINLTEIQDKCTYNRLIVGCKISNIDKIFKFINEHDEVPINKQSIQMELSVEKEVSILKNTNIEINMKINKMFNKDAFRLFKTFMSHFDDFLSYTQYKPNIYIQISFNCNGTFSCPHFGMFYDNKLYIVTPMTCIKLINVIKHKYDELKLEGKSFIFMNEIGSPIYYTKPTDIKSILFAKYLKYFFENVHDGKIYFPHECFEYLCYCDDTEYNSLIDLLRDSVNHSCIIAKNIFEKRNEPYCQQYMGDLIEKYNKRPNINKSIKSVNKKYLNSEVKYVCDDAYAKRFLEFMTCNGTKNHINNPYKNFKI